MWRTIGVTAGLGLLAFSSGCDLGEKKEAERMRAEMEARIADLEARSAKLETENRNLRAGMDRLVVASAMPISLSLSELNKYCTGRDGSYRITRSRVDALFDGNSNLTTQARLMPSFENGILTGYRFLAIRPLSFLRCAGFRTTTSSRP